jgi:hypothetical protein
MDFDTLQKITTGFSGTTLVVVLVFVFRFVTLENSVKSLKEDMEENTKVTNRLGGRVNYLLGKMGLRLPPSEDDT